jgi:hypothetical protein
VAGVVPALKAHDRVRPLGEKIRHLPLPLIAPLGANQYDSGHRRRSVRTAWAESRKGHRGGAGGPEAAGALAGGGRLRRAHGGAVAR